MRKLDGLTEQIMQVVRAKHEEIDATGEVRPAMVADKARQELDPDNVSPALMSWAATLHLRQLARQVCATKAEEEDPSGFLPGIGVTLQKSYPVKRGNEEIYVRRGQLTYADRMYNIRRLRSEGTSKTTHAQGLEAETESLVRLGLLKPEEDSEQSVANDGRF